MDVLLAALGKEQAVKLLRITLRIKGKSPFISLPKGSDFSGQFL